MDGSGEPALSVFTPTHNARWLNDCYDSLRRQTCDEWEWVVVLNGGAMWPNAPYGDKRVNIFDCHQLMGVGAAKAYACERTRGETLVELDHDDVLVSDALARVLEARMFVPDKEFIYSDTAQVQIDLTKDPSKWTGDNGWHYRDETVDGREVMPVAALEPSPHNCSYIWWAPNHLRAFTRRAYEAAGGYDHKRVVCDDLDLMTRLYQVTEFHHIGQCLYLQRLHASNTQAGELNAQIQRDSWALHDERIQGMCLAWAKRNGLHALDLGGAHDSPDGFTAIDYELDNPFGPGKGEAYGVLRSLGDDSVGVVRAHDFLEHITDKVEMMNEVYRVLAPGGMLLSETPSTDGRGAFQDPTHVSFWNENSFWYYTDPQYAKYVPEITARFQVSRLTSYFPSDWHRANNISYVKAHLIATKDGARQGGRVNW